MSRCALCPYFVSNCKQVLYVHVYHYLDLSIVLFNNNKLVLVSVVFIYSIAEVRITFIIKLYGFFFFSFLFFFTLRAVM